VGLTLAWGASFAFVVDAFFFVVFFFAIATCVTAGDLASRDYTLTWFGDMGPGTHTDAAADGPIRQRADALCAMRATAKNRGWQCP
jgi:hypothetical protein